MIFRALNKNVLWGQEPTEVGHWILGVLWHFMQLVLHNGTGAIIYLYVKASSGLSAPMHNRPLLMRLSTLQSPWTVPEMMAMMNERVGGTSALSLVLISLRCKDGNEPFLPGAQLECILPLTMTYSQRWVVLILGHSVEDELEGMGSQRARQLGHG
jgi:hypothetical protein